MGVVMIGSRLYRLCLLCCLAHLMSLLVANLVSARQFLVAVDVGHSKARKGAISATGIGEYDFNESLARLLLSKVPRASGIKLSLINETADEMSLEDRTKAAKVMGADLLISIHHDSVLPEYLTPWTQNGRCLFHCDRFHGFAVFYSERNHDPGRSLQFAKLLGTALVRRNFSPSQHHAEMMKGEGKAVVDAHIGVFRYDGLAVLKNAEMPAVLLECGIIVNRQEEKRLRDDVYKSRIVAAILKSIEVFSWARRR
jgi:N-acetylmuramoyl-L-alanine amidase